MERLDKALSNDYEFLAYTVARYVNETIFQVKKVIEKNSKF